MKANDPSWMVPPRVNTILVGKSGQRKSPVFDPTLAPLYKIQAKLNAEWQRARGQWLQTEQDTREAEPPRPAQLVIHNQTIEGIRDLLVHQMRGVGIVSDEWGSFIGSLGRYSGGRDAGAADRGFMNKLYDGGLYTAVRANRKGGEVISVQNLQGGLLGGVTPSVLRRFNRENELLMDGLLQRCGPILMEPPRDGDDRDVTYPLERYDLLINRLVAMPGQRVLLLSDSANAIRERASERIRVYEQLELLGEGFVTAASKLHGIWGRLALILAHVLSPRDPPQQVGERAALLAERLVFDSLIPNMRLFYEMLGTSGRNTETTQAIAAYLLRHQGPRVRPSDISKHVWALRGNSIERIREALSPLIAMGWLTPEEEDERRARAWIIHQAVHPQFAQRAELFKMQAALLKDDIVKSVKKQAKPDDRANTLEDIEPNASINLEENSIVVEPNARNSLARISAISNPPKISYLDSENAREGRMRKGIPRIRDNTSEQGATLPESNQFSWRDKVRYDVHRRSSDKSHGRQEDDEMLPQDVIDPMGWPD
jgi:hypothetical protein